jgi:hypothetical protein
MFDFAEEDQIEVNADEDSDDGYIPSVEANLDVPNLDTDVLQFNLMYPFCHAQIPKANTVLLTILAEVLEPSLLYIYNFQGSTELLTVELELEYPGWTTPPVAYAVLHPRFAKRFIGYPLVVDVIHRFFSKGFILQMDYRNSVANNVPKEAWTNPLMSLTVEIVEVYADLPDHCCICRSLLPVAGIKPGTCQKDGCVRRLAEFGVGCSIIHEIRRDPIAADLILTLYSAATAATAATAASTVVGPVPPAYLREFEQSLFERMIPMAEAATLQSEFELINRIGQNEFSLLQYILLSNRSHIIALPREMQIPLPSSAFQFMTLMVTPEQEEKFQMLKRRHGSRFFWPGSRGHLWNAILRTGLQNMSGTAGQLNGAAHGSGIYLANDAATSFGYCQQLQFKYRCSQLENGGYAIALCEVATVRQLKKKSFGATLTNEDAIVVRFLIFSDSFSYDVKENPIENVPTLETLMQYIERTAGIT